VLAKLRPAFKPDGGSVTAGTRRASTTARRACRHVGHEGEGARLTPLATIRGVASAGVDPSIMGMGPWPASEKALAKAGLRKEEIDLWELNEAFARSRSACCRELRSRRTAST
jgi:acetyl-CoA acetyltransferase